MNTKNILISIILTVFFSCKKEPGPGGKAHIHGHLYYNNSVVTNGTVYIWYGETNVSDFSSGFGNQISCNSHGEFEFHDLRKGDYFLHATCIDLANSPRAGSRHVEIKSKSETVQADIIVQ